LAEFLRPNPHTGAWRRVAGIKIGGKVLGIYGYGRIGKAVAEYARAFGMEVMIWAREA
jgi:D-3-phosphoglycerate dehydrogenase